MNNITDFIQLNMNFLNDIQSYHWQTESYSEHETTGEYYESCYFINLINLIIHIEIFLMREPDKACKWNYIFRLECVCLIFDLF